MNLRISIWLAGLSKEDLVGGRYFGYLVGFTFVEGAGKIDYPLIIS